MYPGESGRWPLFLPVTKIPRTTIIRILQFNPGKNLCSTDVTGSVKKGPLFFDFYGVIKPVKALPQNPETLLQERLTPISDKEQLDALLQGELEEAKERIQSTEPGRLYPLIKGLGLQDSELIVNLTSAEQTQAFVDLDCWSRDRLNFEQLGEWFRVLLQSDDDKFNALSKDFDPELFGLFLRKNLSIYFFYREEDEKAIDNEERPIEASPDGVYALVMPEDPVLAGIIRLLIFRLYSSDQDRARHLLHAARWEHDSVLEETAYLVRSGRMLQHGFFPWEEAVGVYAYTDPVKAKKGLKKKNTLPPHEHDLTFASLDRTPFPIPRALCETLQDNSPLYSLLLESADPDDPYALDRCLQQLSSLINRVASADPEIANNSEPLTDAAIKTHNYLNIGLEYLLDKETKIGVKLLKGWPLLKILQVGHSLTTSLSKQANRLLQRKMLSLVEEYPTSMCTSADSALLTGLMELPPVLSTKPEQRFTSLSDIEWAASRLSLLAYQEAWAYGIMGFSKESIIASLMEPKSSTDITEISFDGLLTTISARALMSGNAVLNPFLPEDLAPIIANHIHADCISSTFREAIQKVASTPNHRTELTNALVEKWSLEVEAKLTNEFGTLTKEALSNPEFIAPLFILTSTEG
jgi:hypothetical protein